MLKIHKALLYVFTIALLSGCINVFKLSDLRSDEYTYPYNIAKAKQLFEEMGKAHNIDKWNSFDTYNVLFQDEFYGFMGKQANAFKEEKMVFSLNYVPNKFNGQLEILSGEEKGEAWGLQSGQIYKVDAGNAIITNNKDMEFWIPTYQYFIEFPSRIQEASVIDYIGTKTINGVLSEGVIASWNTVNPQKRIDQYIVWINAESKRIVKVEYTVRDANRFITGAALFENYKIFNGVLIPTSFPVESNLLKEGILHKMSIREFTPNKVSLDTLMPLK